MDDATTATGAQSNPRGPWISQMSDDELLAYAREVECAAAWAVNGPRFIANLAAEAIRLRQRDRVSVKLRRHVHELLRRLPVDLPDQAANMRLIIVGDLSEPWA